MELSFEFFPPRSQEQRVVLAETRKQLLPYDPAYYSVTFGAGGSTLDATLDTVREIHKEDSICVAPHLSCMGGKEESIIELLDAYKDAGIRRLLALRGDMPSGMMPWGYFRHANELVQFVRQETGEHFHISVACYPEVHPEAETAKSDFKFFKQKVEAGADSAITQFFFNPESYFYFVDRCEKEGIDIPIIPGIMPISNYSQLNRFAQTCGSDMPRWLAKRLQDFGDDRVSIQEFGTEVISKLCERLIEQGVPGLHIYTLNRSKTTLKVFENLGIEKVK